MKKFLQVLLCVFFITLTFSGCDIVEESKTDISENNSDAASEAPLEQTEEISDDVSEEVSAPNESEMSEAGEESGFNNENASVESAPVENVPEASDDDKNGDLDNTSTVPSGLEVLNIALPPDLYNDAVDLFYSDDEYDYFFPAMTKYAMKVYYSDGSIQSVKEAIDSGNITLADLDEFNVLYLRYSKATGEYDAINGE